MDAGIATADDVAWLRQQQHPYLVVSRKKQIATTGAAYVLTPCHNCHSQMEDIGHFYGGNYGVVHFWTLICLSLGILGENERTYLGPDLLALKQPK